MKVPPMIMNSTYSCINLEEREGSTGVARLIHVMTQTFQLLYTASRLLIGVITGTNGSHASWFIACVTLGAVVKIRIGTAWTVSASSQTTSING